MTKVCYNRRGSFFGILIIRETNMAKYIDDYNDFRAGLGLKPKLTAAQKNDRDVKIISGELCDGDDVIAMVYENE